MADSILYGFVGYIVKRVASVAKKEIDLVVGVKRDLTEFENTLTSIKDVLLDAEGLSEEKPGVKAWLRRLNDVCSDADDMLDGFEYETLRQQVASQGSVTMKVCKFFSNTSPKFRSKMGHKLQAIKKRLDKIAAEKEKFQLTSRVGAEPERLDRDEDSLLPQTLKVFGRDGDIEQFVQRLSLTHANGEENVSVIPIVGMPGLGKSTLARTLYNHETVAELFQTRIWVWVSEVFDIKMVAKDIIASAGGKDCGDLKLDKLAECLRKTLEGKKYLLILDDVWNADYGKWLKLKNLLMYGAEGSKIIVTTRDSSVADIVRTPKEQNHELQVLSQGECSSLFESLAFKEGEEKNPRLLEIGREIVQKCGGLPLAVKTLACALFKTRNVREWKEIKDSFKGTDLSPAWRLSYDRLPSHLKKCFAFCSIFPKNYRLNSLELIRLWIAVGLVNPPDGNLDLEYFGWKYIKQLKSFFQDVEEHGDVFTFKMHDLIHDLASSVADSDVSSSRIYSERDRCVSILSREKVKHLLPVENNVRIIIRPNGGGTSKTFAKTCISRFKYLRVLDLGDSRLEELPSSIGKLKLLRYLSLYNSCIKKLPDSIFKLLNLQTLDLSNCLQLEELPQDIRKLINLRCLYITTKQKSLPENGIGCLKSLKFLGIVGCCNLISLGEEMQRLTALQTLLIGDCRSLRSLPCNMKYLATLENLFIYNCEQLNLMEGEEDIQGISLGLRSTWIARLPQSKALPQWLGGAAETLEHICIGDCCELTAIPEWRKTFTSLKKLVIEDCPELSALPKEMYSFLELKTKIRNCPKLSL